MGLKEVITPQNLKAVGPFSAGVRANGFIFISGQVSLDLETGRPVSGDLRTQTRRALENLKTILEASGSSMTNVVKTSVFLRDIKHWTVMNEVFREFFAKDPPARSTIQAGLVEGYDVEIEAVALQ